MMTTPKGHGDGISPFFEWLGSLVGIPGWVIFWGVIIGALLLVAWWGHKRSGG